MIQRKLRLFRSEVRVEVRGKSPERFLNLCASGGFFLRRVTKGEECLACTMTGEEFRCCRPYARKAGVRVHIREKKGLPFRLFGLRKREGLFLGFLAAVLVLAICSGRLWTIELLDGNRHTLDEFLPFLEACGVDHGMKLADLACGTLEEEIRTAFPDILWVSAQKSGCILRIRIRENSSMENEGEEEENESGTDLVADKDGVIASMITRSGTPLVAAGDEVKKGDVLVEGAYTILDDSGNETAVRPVTADADIVAVTEEAWERTLPLQHESVVAEHPAGFSFSVSCGKRRLSVSICPWAGDAVWTETYRPVILSGFDLPFSFTLSRAVRQDILLETYSDEELDRLCEEKWREYSENCAEKGVQILEKNVKITVGSFALHMEGSVTLREPVGVPAAREKQEDENEEDDDSNA